MRGCSVPDLCYFRAVIFAVVACLVFGAGGAFAQVEETCRDCTIAPGTVKEPTAALLLNEDITKSFTIGGTLRTNKVGAMEVRGAGAFVDENRGSNVRVTIDKGGSLEVTGPTTNAQENWAIYNLASSNNIYTNNGTMKTTEIRNVFLNFGYSDYNRLINNGTIIATGKGVRIFENLGGYFNEFVNNADLKMDGQQSFVFLDSDGEGDRFVNNGRVRTSGESAVFADLGADLASFENNGTVTVSGQGAQVFYSRGAGTTAIQNGTVTAENGAEVADFRDCRSDCKVVLKAGSKTNGNLVISSDTELIIDNAIPFDAAAGGQAVPLAVYDRSQVSTNDGSTPKITERKPYLVVGASTPVKRATRLNKATQVRPRMTLTPAKIKAMKLTTAQLRWMKLTPAQLRAMKLDPAKIKASTLTAADIKATTLTPADIKGLTLTPAQLRAAKLTPAQIRATRLTDAQIKATKLTTAQIRATGLSAAQVRAMKLTPAQITATGLTAAQVRARGLTPTQARQILPAQRPQSLTPASLAIPLTPVTAAQVVVVDNVAVVVTSESFVGTEHPVREAISDTTARVNENIRKRRLIERGGGELFAAAEGGFTTPVPRQVWGEVFGRYNRRPGAGDQLPSQERVYGGVGGIDFRPWDSGAKTGVFASVFETHQELGRKKEVSRKMVRQVRGQGLFLGGYWANNLMGVDLDLTLGGGMARNKSRRFVKGDPEPLTADYRTYTVVPSVRVSSEWSWRDLTLTPSLSGIYTAHYRAAYAEKGGGVLGRAARQRVRGRMTHVVGAVGKVEIGYATDFQHFSHRDEVSTTFSLGLRGDRRLGPVPKVDLSVGGKSLSFTPRVPASRIAGLGGIKLSWTRADNLEFYLDSQAQLGLKKPADKLRPRHAVKKWAQDFGLELSAGLKYAF